MNGNDLFKYCDDNYYDVMKIFVITDVYDDDEDFAIYTHYAVDYADVGDFEDYGNTNVKTEFS